MNRDLYNQLREKLYDIYWCYINSKREALIDSDDRYKDYTNNTFCVSAERINYTPISLAEIITKMKNYEP